MIMVTAYQVELVKHSLSRLEGKQDLLFYAFYSRLSVLVPTVRLVIYGDLRARGDALQHILNAAVTHVDNRAVLQATVWALNEWLGQYCAARLQDPAVTEALLWALSRNLNEAMSPQVLLAWRDLCAELAALDGEPAAAALTWRQPVASADEPTAQIDYDALDGDTARITYN